MNHPVIPILPAAASRERKRQQPKGRRVEPQALDEVRALLGEASRQRDLLIEHLHKIQDRYGCLSAPHLAALAQEMRLAQTEVYEVASFYHHFDVVKEGEPAPAALTVRVCAGLSCEMAGAAELLQKLPAMLGREVRVLAAPCVGRCEQAPVAVVGQNPIPQATCDAVVQAVAKRRLAACAAAVSGLRRLPGAGRLPAAAALPCRRPGARAIAGHDGKFRPARPRRRRFSGRPQMAHRRRRSRAAADGGQHRRGRAGHLQGPLLPGARSAPLPGRHAGRGLGGRHRRNLYLPARRIPRLPRAAGSRTGRLAGRAAGVGRCRRSICGAAPAPTSAAKSRP